MTQDANRAALTLLHALHDAGHSVRRDDTGEQPQIMIGPPPTAEMAAQIRQHREGLLYVLEQGWPKEEREALAAWQRWNEWIA